MREFLALAAGELLHRRHLLDRQAELFGILGSLVNGLGRGHEVVGQALHAEGAGKAGHPRGEGALEALELVGGLLQAGVQLGGVGRQKYRQVADAGHQPFSRNLPPSEAQTSLPRATHCSGVRLGRGVHSSRQSLTFTGLPLVRLTLITVAVTWAARMSARSSPIGPAARA